MRAILVIVVLGLGAFACAHKVALYCDDNTPCTDPARPFCDVAGEFPASDGITNTCIPDPLPDGGAMSPDGSTPRLPIVQLTAGHAFTCALLGTGAVRCWGTNTNGQLGYGHDNNIGDNEHPYIAGDVPLGGPARQISAGLWHACALLENGAIRCWGYNRNGELGYGMTEYIGDNETPASFGMDVDVGGPALQVVAGNNFTCALLVGGAVRCWGINQHGVLGPSAPDIVGDNEKPITQVPIDIGGAATALSAGERHVCALLEGGAVQCWGQNMKGNCGYPTQQNVGDDETPASLGPVSIGGSAIAISAGGATSCAVLSNGAVRCWGFGASLGYGNVQTIGDNEDPAVAGDVSLGGNVAQLTTARSARCTAFEDGSARCWGNSLQTGYGDGNSIGDNEVPSSYPPLAIDRPVVRFLEHSAAGSVVCVIVDTGGVRCWGPSGEEGALGYANTESIGDNEPLQNVDVQILDP